MWSSNKSALYPSESEALAAPVAFALAEREWASFFTPERREELQHEFPSAVILPGDLSGVELIAQLREHGSRVLVGGWAMPKLPSDRSEFPELEYICYLSGSIRRKIPRALVEQGITVSNWGTCIAPTVAECALLLLLMCYREASSWQVRMHSEGAFKTLNDRGNLSLFRRRVGIHGFGAVAQALVELLKPFGCEIAAYSPWPEDRLFAAKGVRRLDSLDSLFAWSEAVVEAEGCSPETIGSVGEAHLRQLGDGVFVNIARAELVDEQALLHVAHEGRLRLGLDVFHIEPLPADYPLRGLPNVALLPHLGGPTMDRRVDAGELALENLKNYLAGKPVRFSISPGQYDRMT